MLSRIALAIHTKQSASNS